MKTPASLESLITALRVMPGVGPKTAQRMAYHLMQRDPGGADRLARAIDHARTHLKHCARCNTFSETELCALCANPRRDRSLLCVIETPADVLAVEQATGFQGVYFVLMGHLSPLDGIGPAELGLDSLEARLDGGEIHEIILATNPTVEGEATAYYIAELARERGVRATRIAHGVPLGGELESVDGGTLAHAFAGRRDL